MKLTNFKIFKNNFYDKFDDASIFDCDDFNLIKVVLDGLKVNYAIDSAVPDWMWNSELGFRKNYYLRMLKCRTKFAVNKNKFWKKIGKQKHKKYWFGFIVAPTIDENGNSINAYSNNITKHFKANDVCNISNNNTTFEVDFTVAEVDETKYYSQLSKADIALWQKIKNTITLVFKNISFTEVETQSIKIAASSFFMQYKMWNSIFKIAKPVTFLLDQHYHREGLLLACKYNKIKTIELQHGLIAKEDIFYCLPNKIKRVANKALFADNIMLYGNYWRNTLLSGFEYTQNNAFILGYYPYTKTDSSTTETLFFGKLKSKKIILVSSQTYLEEYFIEYIKLLNEKCSNDYKIVLKPHPNENLELYEKQLVNCTNVEITNLNIDILLMKCEFQITCYSTTIFDAFRHNKKSFSINIPACSDYVEALIKANFSIKLNLNETPFDKLHLLNTIEINAKEFYSDFNFEELNKILCK